MKDWFLLCLALWAVPICHHLERLVRRRHPLSAVAMVAPLGWVFYCGREAHEISLQVAHVGTALALVLGVFSAGLCIATRVAEWTRG